MEGTANDLPDLSGVPLARTEPCCGNCPYYRANQNGKTGVCIAEAPMPILLGIVPSPIEGRMGRPLVDGFFPPTNPMVLCGRHPRFHEEPPKSELVRLAGLDIAGEA